MLFRSGAAPAKADQGGGGSGPHREAGRWANESRSDEEATQRSGVEGDELRRIRARGRSVRIGKPPLGGEWDEILYRLRIVTMFINLVMIPTRIVPILPQNPPGDRPGLAKCSQAV